MMMMIPTGIKYFRENLCRILSQLYSIASTVDRISCTSIGFHYDNRAVAIKLVYGDIRIILVGVYFSYDRNSPNYSAGVCSVTGFIESVLTDNPGFNVIVAGDF